MADIAAVLKKTIDGLPRHDAAIRAKVYDKARIQIRSKLLAAKPDADQATIERNMAVVERAIQAVEDEYRFQDDLGDVLGPKRQVAFAPRAGSWRRAGRDRRPNRRRRACGTPPEETEEERAGAPPPPKKPPMRRCSADQQADRCRQPIRCLPMRGLSRSQSRSSPRRRERTSLPARSTK